jgi:LemA protein
LNTHFGARGRSPHVEGTRIRNSSATQVFEARANASQVQLPGDHLSNPQAFHQFEQNQAAIGGALGRLLAVSEKYPALKSHQNFLAFQP